MACQGGSGKGREEDRGDQLESVRDKRGQANSQEATSFSGESALEMEPCGEAG